MEILNGQRLNVDFFKDINGIQVIHTDTLDLQENEGIKFLFITADFHKRVICCDSPLRIFINIINFDGFYCFILNNSSKEIDILGQKFIKLLPSQMAIVFKDGDNALVTTLGGINHSIQEIDSSNIDSLNIQNNNIIIVKEESDIDLPLTENLEFYVKRDFETGTLKLYVENSTIDGDTEIFLENYETIHLYCNGVKYYII